MEEQPDLDTIAEEAVGQRHGSAPPDALKDMWSQEAVRWVATSSGAQASTSKETAEALGERVGTSCSDAGSTQARFRGRGASECGLSVGRQAAQIVSLPFSNSGSSP